MKKLTSAPVHPGNFTGAQPEFGRTKDLEKLYGLRRGTVYNLLALGKIRGCVLRVRGKKSGIRLFDLESVRQFIRSQMTKEEAA